MSPKPKRKLYKRKRSGKIIFLLILIAIGFLGLFHQQIYQSIKPFFKKKTLLAGTREVLLYFSDPKGEFLIGEKREILKKDKLKEEAKDALIELIKGPRGKLVPTLPPKTKLLSIRVDDTGLTEVNFNSALSREHPGGSTAEMMTIYSIANTLVFNFPQIKRIQILIEGKPIETIAGHISLRQPITSKPDLIKGRN